jgi:hypothetical protein
MFHLKIVSVKWFKIKGAKEEITGENKEDKAMPKLGG